MPGADNKTFIRHTTIPAGSVSPAAPADLSDMVLVGIITPATVAGANLTFRGAGGNTALNPVYNEDGDAVTVPMGGSRFIAVKPTTLSGVTKLLLVSDVAAGAGGEAYTLVVRSID